MLAGMKGSSTSMPRDRDTMRLDHDIVFIPKSTPQIRGVCDVLPPLKAGNPAGLEGAHLLAEIRPI